MTSDCLRARRGFTLVETMVALAIGGSVLVLVGRTFAAVSDGARRIEASRAEHDGRADGRRWLRGALGSNHPPTDREPFDGRREVLAFSASTRRPDGQFGAERIRVRSIGNTLVAERSIEGEVVLIDGVASVAFDYLVAPGADSRWMSQWVSATTSPLAVRFRLARTVDAAVDTAIILIRDRR